MSAIEELTVEREPTYAPPKRNLVRASLLNMTMNAGVLALNLVTGILIARVLGPDGRGALTAVLAAPPFLAWIFEMGCNSAATYHQARQPTSAGSLIATWFVILVPLALLGIAIGEVLLPHLLAAQSAHTLFLARLLMLTLVLTFLADLMFGMLLGDQDFTAYTFLRVAHPIAITAEYLVLWPLGRLTVASAVAANVITAAAVTAVVTTRVLRRHGLARPSFELGRRTLWYGLRAHSTMAAGLVNLRFDLLIIPAFVAASSVGLYSIATNVSWIVASAAGSFTSLLFPAAVARGPSGRYTVVKSMYAALAIALLAAGVLAAVAPFAVRLLYGSAFLGSVEPLRILLVGTVLYIAAAAPCAGLYAVDRPFTAGIAQVSAAVVTIVGLSLFLRHGGIVVAATVSTIAYSVVFVVAVVLYRRAVGLSWRELAPTPSLMRVWMRQAARSALGRA